MSKCICEYYKAKVVELMKSFRVCFPCCVLQRIRSMPVTPTALVYDGYLFMAVEISENARGYLLKNHESEF